MYLTYGVVNTWICRVAHNMDNSVSYIRRKITAKIHQDWGRNEISFKLIDVVRHFLEPASFQC